MGTFEFDERTIQFYTNLKVPSTYWKERSWEYCYWFRSLMQKIDSSLIFKNLPKGWSEDFFHFCLNYLGFVTVFHTNREDLLKYGEGGVVFQPCTLGGFDFYYNPKYAMVTNPMYQKKLTLSKDAELMKLTPDFRGTFDILDFYATRLAELSKSIMMAIKTSKYGMILTATNEAQSATLKKVWDKIQAGEELVVYKDDKETSDEIVPMEEPFKAWTQELKDNYVLDKLLADMNTILDSFYCEIGLPISPTQKKERLITSEADFGMAQSQARISCWYATLNESLEVINNKFGTNMEVIISARENDIDRDGDGAAGEQ